jgi:pyruvate formate lyase activating enzyme
MKEALYYASLNGGKIRCELCPHLCVIAPKKRSICRTRVNEDGALYLQQPMKRCICRNHHSK